MVNIFTKLVKGSSTKEEDSQIEPFFYRSGSDIKYSGPIYRGDPVADCLNTTHKNCLRDVLTREPKTADNSVHLRLPVSVDELNYEMCLPLTTVPSTIVRVTMADGSPVTADALSHLTTQRISKAYDLARKRDLSFADSAITNLKMPALVSIEKPLANPLITTTYPKTESLEYLVDNNMDAAENLQKDLSDLKKAKGPKSGNLPILEGLIPVGNNLYLVPKEREPEFIIDAEDSALKTLMNQYKSESDKFVSFGDYLQLRYPGLDSTKYGGGTPEENYNLIKSMK